MKRFYVYFWVRNNDNHVFHIGKGTGDRYKDLRDRNNHFINYIKKYECSSYIYKNNLTEQEAWDLEKELISKYKKMGQCETNYHCGGSGGNIWIYKSDEEKEPFRKKMREIALKSENRHKFKVGWYDEEIIKRRAKTHSGKGHWRSRAFEVTYPNGETYNFDTMTDVLNHLGISKPTFYKIIKGGDVSFKRNARLRKIKDVKIKEVK